MRRTRALFDPADASAPPPLLPTQWGHHTTRSKFGDELPSKRYDGQYCERGANARSLRRRQLQLQLVEDPSGNPGKEPKTASGAASAAWSAA